MALVETFHNFLKQRLVNFKFTDTCTIHYQIEVKIFRHNVCNSFVMNKSGKRKVSTKKKIHRDIIYIRIVSLRPSYTET